MKIEIIFEPASKPKIIDKVDSVYTKDRLICIQFIDGWIDKYPEGMIFKIRHKHGPHGGSIKDPKDF